jgi:plastocyanin
MRPGRLGFFIPAAGAAAALALASPASAAPRVYTIVLDKMKFGAAPAGLHAGDRIVWVNRDFIRHSATAADRSFDLDLPPGKSAAVVLRKPGVVAVSCKFHPGMKVQINVVK